MEKQNYLHPTQENGKRFFQNFHDKGSVVMLNLLRFKEVADYSNLDSIRPEQPLSGEEAYRLYMKYTLPFLEESGGEVLFYGKSNHFLIGPQDEKWDMVLLVRHVSVATFMKFAENEAYLKIAGHRTAALEDSRLLPMVNAQNE